MSQQEAMVVIRVHQKNVSLLVPVVKRFHINIPQILLAQVKQLKLILKLSSNLEQRVHILINAPILDVAVCIIIHMMSQQEAMEVK
jgi:uncharacterized protein with gpF-like domain